jgi:hypothetical protein
MLNKLSVYLTCVFTQFINTWIKTVLEKINKHRFRTYLSRLSSLQNEDATVTTIIWYLPWMNV